MGNPKEYKKDWYYYEDGAKVVTKPWGREVWINYYDGEDIGDEEKDYVMKKLYMKAGTKTSFQYHEKKIETNFMIEGEVEAWLENEDGVIERKNMGPGAIWTIPCGRKHRIITLTDVVFMEGSNPYIDDVIRLEDDTLRPDGRVQSEHDEGKKFNKENQE